MRFSRFCTAAALIAASMAAGAQAAATSARSEGATVSKEYPVAISFHYSAMIGNAPPGTCGCFLLNGGSSEEMFHVWKGIAAVAAISGNRAARIPQSEEGLSLITYMAGPRYSFRVLPRVTTYGQFLAGGAHGFDTYFPRNDSQSTGAGNSLAFAPGAGVEIGVKHWLSVRAVGAEYLITHLPNSVNAYQRSFRVNSGVIFRFSTPRLNR